VPANVDLTLVAMSMVNFMTPVMERDPAMASEPAMLVKASPALPPQFTGQLSNMDAWPASVPQPGMAYHPRPRPGRLDGDRGSLVRGWFWPSSPEQA